MATVKLLKPSEISIQDESSDDQTSFFIFLQSNGKNKLDLRHLGLGVWLRSFAFLMVREMLQLQRSLKGFCRQWFLNLVLMWWGLILSLTTSNEAL